MTKRLKFLFILLYISLGVYIGTKFDTDDEGKAEGQILSIVNNSKIVAHIGIWGEGPAIFFLNQQGQPTFEMGVHSNGFPFVLSTDGKIRNFILGRVDGKNASPILVYRYDDIVKMVFGLDMVAEGQEPFFVHYANDKKNLLFGNYCDNPGRACTY